jgi:hypothetical protein
VKQKAYLAKTKVPDTMEWLYFLHHAQILLKQSNHPGPSRAINESFGGPTSEIEEDIGSSSNAQHNNLDLQTENGGNLTIALILYWGITDR